MTRDLDKSGAAYENLTWGNIALYFIGYYPVKNIVQYIHGPSDQRDMDRARTSGIYLVGSAIASSLVFGFVSSKIFDKPFKEAALYSLGGTVALNAAFFAYGFYDVSKNKS